MSDLVSNLEKLRKELEEVRAKSIENLHAARAMRGENSKCWVRITKLENENADLKREVEALKLKNVELSKKLHEQKEES